MPPSHCDCQITLKKCDNAHLTCQCHIQKCLSEGYKIHLPLQKQSEVNDRLCEHKKKSSLAQAILKHDIIGKSETFSAFQQDIHAL